jgi:hypothetical protein
VAADTASTNPTEVAMNVATLIKQHPLLTADLRNLGLTNRTLHAVADDISTQLSGDKQGHKSFNLCYIFNGLSSGEFVKAVDAKKVAEEANLSPALAQTIVLTIAPWVDKFQLRVAP